MLLVSGLGLGGGGGESLLGTQLLVDVVTGQLGDEGEQCSAAHVSRVILAGNLLSHNTQSRDSINKVWSPWERNWQGLMLRGCPRKAPLPEGVGARVESRAGQPLPTCPVYPLLTFAFLRVKGPGGLWVSP